ncbi:MAG: hypothetical protein KF861_05660 [Planctomycetaceae bacterium]|nr:hypothetical protein [Planctomycetaceae bacterium]
MPRLLTHCTRLMLVLLVGGFAIATSAIADDPPRIKVLLSSPQGLIDDIQYLVVDLAQEKKQWDDNIRPSIEIFLLGVDYNKPLRWDLLVNNEGANQKSGYRYQPSIPINRDGAELRTFIKDNLNPIGINERQRKRDYYMLTGDVFEGWMRIVDKTKKDYACIAAKGYEGDIPENMPHPSQSHAELLKQGYDIALDLSNSPEFNDLRKSQADSLLAFMMKDVAPKANESAAAFELRKLSQQQKYEQLHRVYVEGEHLTVGLRTSREKRQTVAEFDLRALPETPLAEYVQTMGAEPSRFDVLEMPEDPVVGMRVNFPFDDFRRAQLTQWYPAALKAAQGSIETSDRFKANEKGPAKEVAQRFFDMLIAGDPLGKLDLFTDVRVGANGKHVFVSGVVAHNGKAADEIVKLLPQVQEGWKVQMDQETVGGTAIHYVDVSANVPQSINDFFGPSGKVYVATNANTVWVAGGDNSLDLLKEAIDKVGAADQQRELGVQVVSAVADNAPVTFFDLKLHAAPLINFSSAFGKETGLSLTKSITIKPPGGAAGASGQGRTNLQPIDPEEMREIVRKALIDIDDRVTGVISRTGDNVAGRMTLDAGILRAVGKIAAKIAKDNL